jgi:hypothetical protein
MREKNCYFRGKLLLSPPLVSLTFASRNSIQPYGKIITGSGFCLALLWLFSKAADGSVPDFRESSYDSTNPVAEEAKKLLLK